MASVIGWIIILAPIIFKLCAKFFPVIGKAIMRLAGKGGSVVAGASIGSVYASSGVLGAIFFVVSKIWGWLTKFPGWLKYLFGEGGKLFFIHKFFMFAITFFKNPIILALSLITSVVFPTILEKIFLVVGAIGLKIFMFFFKIGKAAFMGAMQSAAQGGGNALDEFRDAILGSFDEFPPCMIQTMGYLHLVEDLGIFMTCISLLVIVSVFKTVYSVGKVQPLGYFS